MKKIITLILAILMAFSVVISGCSVTGGGNGGNNNGGSNNGSSDNGSGDNGSGDNGSGDNGSDDGTDEDYSYLFSTNKDSKGRYVHEAGRTYSDQIGNYDYDIMTESQYEAIYNKDVFYRNDIVVDCADPEVMYISDPENPYYDQYIMYGTTGTGVYNCFSSKDLVSWRGVGGAYVWPDGGWQESKCWAPGAIWDEFADREYYGLNPNDPGKGVYFLFCSASTDPLYTIQANSGNCYLDCVVSTSPAGPFQPALKPELGAVIDGVDYSKAENFAKYTVYNGYNLSGETIQLNGGQTVHVSRYGDKLDVNDTWFNFAAARASFDWQFKNKAIAGQKDAKGVEVPYTAAFLPYDYSGPNDCIDPTPFLDYNDMVTKTKEVNGETITWQEPRKYLFYSSGSRENKSIAPDGQPYMNGTEINGFRFYNNDWATPDYTTITRVTRTLANMVSQEAADYYNQQAAAYVPSNYPANQPKETELAVFGPSQVEYRIKANNDINEGAQAFYNKENGMYYLTISAGSYTNTTYHLLQLVAYSPMGPYRKLDVGEGGLLLGTDAGRVTDVITGPGHHTFMEVYDHPTENDNDPTNDRPRQYACVYHRHINLRYSPYARGPVMDEVKWVRNNEGMLVMHTNGPTTFIQPRLYGTGDTPYYNIATDDSTVIKIESPSGGVAQGNDIKYLTDGIIPIYSDVSTAALPALESYVYEYSSTESKGIAVTITFPTYRKVTAIMVYNSKDYNKAFSSVRNIEFDVRRGNWTATTIISRINFNWDWNQQYGVEIMRPGGSVVAYFDEIEIKEIRFLIPRDSVASAINIPELVVLGKPIGQ